MPAIALKEPNDALVGFLLLESESLSVGAVDGVFMVAPGAQSTIASVLGTLKHREFRLTISELEVATLVRGQAPNGYELQVSLQASGQGEWRLLGEEFRFFGPCELAATK